MKSNNILVVGCGAIAKSFHLPALVKSIPRENIYLYDIDQKNAEDLADYFNLKNILKDLEHIPSDIRGAIVAVPFEFSFEITLSLLKKKINVLCEKPIATNSEQIIQLSDSAKNNNVFLCGNHTRRFFPSIIKLKKELQSHKIQEINIFEGDPFSWNSKSGFYFKGSRGVLLDRGPHVINIVNYLTDNQSLSAEKFMHNAQPNCPESHCKIILSSNNIKIKIIMSWIYKLANEIEIITNKGKFNIGISSFNYFSFSNSKSNNNFTAYPIKTQFNQMSTFVISSFLDQINFQTSNSILLEDIRSSVLLIENLYNIGEQINEW